MHKDLLSSLSTDAAAPVRRAGSDPRRIGPPPTRAVHRAVADARRGVPVVLAAQRPLIAVPAETVGAEGLRLIDRLSAGPAVLLLAASRAAAVLGEELVDRGEDNAVALALEPRLIDPETLRRAADPTLEQILPRFERAAVPTEAAAALGLAKLARLLPAVIASWRKIFDQGNFPFYIVQWPSFGPRSPVPTDDNWADIRESMAIVAATVPNSCLAVTIDTGDPKSLHPGDKKPVGDRLAYCALAKHYGMHVVYSGPTLASVQRLPHSIRLRFHAQVNARRPSTVRNRVAEVVDPDFFHPRAITYSRRPR